MDDDFFEEEQFSPVISHMRLSVLIWPGKNFDIFLRLAGSGAVPIKDSLRWFWILNGRTQ